MQRYTFDNLGRLKDAGLIAATANALVDGAPKILDVGQGRVSATAVIDVSAIEIGTGDEHYWVLLQGSTDSAFGSGVVNLAMMEFGALATLLGGASAAPLTGRYSLAYSNEQNGVLYRYVRIRTIVAGTIATGINYAAFTTPDPF